MNPPPDKKRRTGPDQPGMGKAEEDNPWGDEFTADEFDFLLSQADVTTPDPPPSSQLTLAAISQSQTRGGAATSSYSHQAKVPRLGEAVASSSRQHYETSVKSSSSSSDSSKGRPPERNRLSRSRLAAGDAVRPAGSASTGRSQAQFPEELLRCLQEKEKEMAEHQAELIHLRDELTAREGEVSLQKETIIQKEAEIHKYKQEKMGQMEADKRERSAKEKQLQMEVERLVSQVQFKEHEVSGVLNKCRSLEMKIAQLEGRVTSPVKLSTQSPRVHPVRRRSPEKSPLPGYPTLESFQANLQDSNGRKDTSDDAITDDTETVTSGTSQRKHPLPTTVSKGVLSGPQLVSRLLGDCCQLHVEADQPMPGMLRLMLPRGRTPLNLSTVYLEREGGNLLFSPKQLKRPSYTQRSLSVSKASAYQESHGKTPSENAQKNLTLANVGLCTMLSGEYSSRELSGFVCDPSDDTESETLVTHGAIFLLPLIEDCVREYSRMLSATSDENFSSPMTSLGSMGAETGSSSDRSSFHSVSSSLNLLLREGATYANSLEEMTVAALNVLYELVSHCPQVVTWIFTQCRAASEKKSPRGSGGPVDDKQEEPAAGPSKLSSKPSDTVPKPSPSLDTSRLADLQILYYIITLADPGMDNGLVNRQSVVELCLDILYKLSLQCSSQQIHCLSPLVSLGVLHTCLGPDVTPSVSRRAVRVLTQLVQSNSVLASLCSASDGCIWMCVYGLCTSKPVQASPQRNTIYTNIIHCLSTVVSTSRTGVSRLVDSSCVCNTELIKGITGLLSGLLEEYTSSKSSSTLDVIKMGVAFLHVLCQTDCHLLAERQDDTVHNFARLVCGLTELYKQVPGVTDNELSALNELWEFLQEDGGGDSQMDVG